MPTPRARCGCGRYEPIDERLPLNSALDWREVDWDADLVAGSTDVVEHANRLSVGAQPRKPPPRGALFPSGPLPPMAALGPPGGGGGGGRGGGAPPEGGEAPIAGLLDKLLLTVIKQKLPADDEPFLDAPDDGGPLPRASSRARQRASRLPPLLTQSQLLSQSSMTSNASLSDAVLDSAVALYDQVHPVRPRPRRVPPPPTPSAASTTSFFFLPPTAVAEEEMHASRLRAGNSAGGLGVGLGVSASMPLLLSR